MQLRGQSARHSDNDQDEGGDLGAAFHAFLIDA
jgi:hypothetical protein